MDFKRKDCYSIEDLKEIMGILRGKGGCPWDREQTHESIRKNLIEETYEAVEAIDCHDSELLREELGDVLLQIVFHSRMEEEAGRFCFDDVTNEICQKLILRHPHIFGDVTVNGIEDVLDNWNAIKQESKGQTTASQTLEAVPRQLPALMRSEKVQSRAAKANPVFGYADGGAALAGLTSELGGLSEAVSTASAEEIAGKLGDVLFAAVHLARKYELDPEELLTRSCDRFITRFTRAERMSGEQGTALKDAGVHLLDKL